MKRANSTLDICGNFGRIFNFGSIIPSESKFNRDLYSNIHFINTLETADPISIDKDTIEFRKKYQPELYSKG